MSIMLLSNSELIEPLYTVPLVDTDDSLTVAEWTKVGEMKDLLQVLHPFDMHWPNTHLLQSRLTHCPYHTSFLQCHFTAIYVSRALAFARSGRCASIPDICWIFFTIYGLLIKKNRNRVTVFRSTDVPDIQRDTQIKILGVTITNPLSAVSMFVMSLVKVDKLCRPTFLKFFVPMAWMM